jgi:hypothetical protein
VILAKSIETIAFALISLGGLITLPIGLVQFLQTQKYPEEKQRYPVVGACNGQGRHRDDYKGVGRALEPPLIP